jgi:hypothetical protein
MDRVVVGIKLAVRPERVKSQGQVEVRPQAGFHQPRHYLLLATSIVYYFQTANGSH